MDKRKVIHAYKRGMISLRECAQILGIDSMQVMNVVNEPQDAKSSRAVAKQPANS